MFHGDVPHEVLIPIPTDADARDALLRRVRELAALEHPRVEPVVGAQLRDDGVLVVRRGAGAAAGLPAVLAVRGRLSVAEACGLLVAVAQGLAALHSAGLDQGGVGPADVVLAADGTAMLRPAVLIEAGGAPAPGTQPDDAAAHDVHTLAALVADLLGDGAGGRARGGRTDDAVALRAVLAPALAPDPRVRPEAGTLAAEAADACAHEALHLPERARLAAAALGVALRDPTADPTTGGPEGVASSDGVRARRAVRRPGQSGARTRAEVHRRRGDGAARRPGRRPRGRGRGRDHAPRPAWWRRARSGLVAVVGVGVVVTALAGVVLEVRQPDASGDPEAAATTPGHEPSEPATGPTDAVRDRKDPAGAAAALTRSRVALLAGGPGSVDEIDLPGSAAHDADSRLLADVEAAGTRVEGAQVEVHATRTRDRTGSTAQVEVDYEIGPHVQQAGDGSTTQVAASGVRSATLDLTWTDGGWRVTGVV